MIGMIRMSEQERETFTKVAKVFYEACISDGKKKWEDLKDREKEPFIEGQAWLYGFYSRAYDRGYNRAIEDAQDKLEGMQKIQMLIQRH